MSLSKIKFQPMLVALAGLTLILLPGCLDAPEPVAQEKPKKVFGEKTSDIGEAQPGAAQADMQVKPGNPLTDIVRAPLAGYGSAISDISKLQIKRMVDLYRAETGDYPKSHQEFMEKIVRRHQIELPVLPGGRQYQYDVDKHELIVVEAPK